MPKFPLFKTNICWITIRKEQNSQQCSHRMRTIQKSIRNYVALKEKRLERRQIDRPWGHQELTLCPLHSAFARYEEIIKLDTLKAKNIQLKVRYTKLIQFISVYINTLYCWSWADIFSLLSRSMCLLSWIASNTRDALFMTPSNAPSMIGYS
mgnify:CR=1 FL=1